MILEMLHSHKRLFFGLLTALISSMTVVIRCQASVTARAEPLEGKVLMAETVALVRVKEITDVVGASGKICGTNYKTEVLYAYKGGRSEYIAFAANSSAISLPFVRVRVGDKLLVLLRSAAALDEIPDSYKPDVVTGLPDFKCLKQLDRNRLLQNSAIGESGYLLEHRNESASEETDWLAFVDSSTVMPYEVSKFERPFEIQCSHDNCRADPRRIVPWKMLSKKIVAWVTEK